MRKSLLFIFLGFWFSTAKVFSQEILPTDSTAWINFLGVQGQVPGLGFQLVFPNSSDSSKIMSLGFELSASDSGWVSGVQDNFDILANLEVDSLHYQLYYTIFSSLNSEEAAREYLSNLIRNGDYDPKTEKEKPREDLVAIAVKSPYTPLFANKYSFTSDLKLFGVTAIIIFFFAMALLMIIYLLILKARKNRRELLEKEYDQMIIDPLTQLLFEKELEELAKMKKSDFEEFFPQALLAKPIYREVLIDGIIGLNKKMKGEFKGKLKAIYHQLELDKVSADKIQKSKWHIVADGLVEINEMDLVECLPNVKKLTNSSNFHVRSLAVAAMLNLSEKSDLSFLRDQTYPLSDWQQMNYLRIIKFVSQQKVLKIEMLFDSSNPSIRVFGYKLVRMLGRVDLLEKLAELAPKSTSKEKIEILKTYQELGAHMEVGFINDCLNSSDTLLVKQAIQTSRSLGDEKSVSILASMVERFDDFGMKLSALRSIYELDRQVFDELTLGVQSPVFKEIRNHILDPKLAHV